MSKTSYPGIVEKAHPEIFDLRAMPPQPKDLKPGQLEKEKIKQFFEKGYLLIPEFFKKEELGQCLKDVELQIDDLAQKLFKAGKITSLHEDKDIHHRVTVLEKEFPGTTVLLIKHMELAKSHQDLFSNDRLLNLVEQLIGPEVGGHPVWNLRFKIPQNEATDVPWHQDSGYMDTDSYKSMYVTAWIPLVDTNKENGCLEIVPGAHRPGKVARHTCCWRDTWYVDLAEEDMQKDLGVNVSHAKVLCPVPLGGLLLFHNLIPHRSLANTSDGIRWSFDFRWYNSKNPIGFFGLKEGVLMRSEKTPVTKIDWDTFNSVNRDDAADDKLRGEHSDEFEPIIVGPWMTQWEMTHTNKHTDKLMATKKPETPTKA